MSMSKFHNSADKNMRESSEAMYICMRVDERKDVYIQQGYNNLRSQGNFFL